MLEVDSWTRTLIPADIGTFVVPLSTYVLIETHIKVLPHTISDKDAVIRTGCIYKVNIVEDVLVS